MLFLKHLVGTISVTSDISVKILIELSQVIRTTGELVTEKDNGMAV
jgi:uncharacterized protein YbaP (TraB family)